MKSTPSSGAPTILAFESRMAETTAKLLHRNGISVLSAPSMQEVPLEQHEALFSFGEKLLAGSIDILICTTGVGTNMMVETLETQYERADIRNALSEIVIISRGPKPAKVLRRLEIPITIKVPEPNTWKEILKILDLSKQTSNLKGKVVAIQEYGKTNNELNDGIRTRGADLCQVPIYRWELPDDLGPLQKGIRALINGEIQVVLFTSKTQINHVMTVARQMGVEQEIRTGMNAIFVASIGPVCSSGLKSHSIKVDFEPSRPKLGVFIKELSSRITKN